jgi:hypothetical protein
LAGAAGGVVGTVVTGDDGLGFVGVGATAAGGGAAAGAVIAVSGPVVLRVGRPKSCG